VNAAWRPGWVDLPEYPNAPLNDEIITRKRPSDILQLFEEKREEFNYVNAVTALHRIAKSKSGISVITSPHFVDLLASVTPVLPQVIEEPDAAIRHGKAWPPPAKHHQNLSNTAWALSRLSVVDEP